MKKWQINLIKLLLMLAVIGYVGREMKKVWGTAQDPQLHVDWQFAVLAVLCFCASMLSSALVWLWLTRKMGDRSRKLPAIGAYIFSQMGKYVPGKVMLLLMRIERTKRLGMSAQVCTVATLVENAMYLVSGGLATLVTLLIFVHDDPKYLVIVGVGLVALCGLFYPRLFYWVVNKTLVKMKQPPVSKEQQLGKTELLLAVAGFMPCWLFGGLALWLSARSITVVDIASFDRLPGAYAFSVTGGMVSLFPGGLVIRETLLTVFLKPVLPSPQAVLLAVAVQRLVQMLAEALMGAIGAVLTSVKRLRRAKGGEPIAPPGHEGPKVRQPEQTTE